MEKRDETPTKKEKKDLYTLLHSIRSLFCPARAKKKRTARLYHREIV